MCIRDSWESPVDEHGATRATVALATVTGGLGRPSRSPPMEVIPTEVRASSTRSGGSAPGSGGAAGHRRGSGVGALPASVGILDPGLSVGRSALVAPRWSPPPDPAVGRVAGRPRLLYARLGPVP